MEIVQQPLAALPDYARIPIASLFRAAERVASARRCRELQVETQNVNVAACRFYERQGCRLREARRDAYPELPHEIQLIWCKELGTGG